MFFRLWRGHSWFRDLVDLLFISEYELHESLEERSPRARAIDNGEMLVAILVADLVPADSDRERFRDLRGRTLTHSQLETAKIKGKVSFRSFCAVSGEDMEVGVKESLRPEVVLMKKDATPYHVRKHGEGSEEKPKVFRFLQIYLESIRHSVVIPFALTPSTISEALRGIGHTDILREFGGQPVGPLPYSVETLLR